MQCNRGKQLAYQYHGQTMGYMYTVVNGGICVDFVTNLLTAGGGYHCGLNSGKSPTFCRLVTLKINVRRPHKKGPKRNWFRLLADIDKLT